MQPDAPVACDWQMLVKALKGRLALSRYDLAEIVAAGGIDRSPSQCDAWVRSGERARPVSREEGLAFLDGLPAWLRQQGY